MTVPPATLFPATLAVVFHAIGCVLYPAALTGQTALWWMTAAPALALLLLATGVTGLPSLNATGRAMSALWPLVAMTIVLQGTDRAAFLSGLGAAPFATASLAAGLVLVPPRSARPLPALALFPFGAALAALVGTLAVAFAPGLAALGLSSPYHVLILLTFCAVLVALSDAATSGLPPARDRLLRALIGLLPLLGFLGTIAGLIDAMANLPALFDDGGATSDALPLVLRGLSTAFETTLVGLVGAALAGFLLMLLNEREATRP